MSVKNAHSRFASAVNAVQQVNIPTLFQTANVFVSLVVHLDGNIARMNRKIKSYVQYVQKSVILLKGIKKSL